MRRHYSEPMIPMAEDKLASGRGVRTTFDRNTGEVLVEVYDLAHRLTHLSKRVPLYGFPLFGRPLSTRIRSAVEELDAKLGLPNNGHEDGEIAAARDAVDVALYHGSPLEECAGGYFRQYAPLIHRAPPPVPPAPRRAAESGVREGREVQMPPLRQPPDDPPSE